VVFSFEVSRLGGEIADLEAAVQERGRALLDEALARAEGSGVPVEAVIRGRCSSCARRAEEPLGTCLWDRFVHRASDRVSVGRRTRAEILARVAVAPLQGRLRPC
jgi:hypothetical protein